MWQWPVLPFSFLSASYFNLKIKNKFTSAHLGIFTKQKQPATGCNDIVSLLENLVLKMQNMTFYASTEQWRDFSLFSCTQPASLHHCLQGHPCTCEIEL